MHFYSFWLYFSLLRNLGQGRTHTENEDVT